MADLRQAVTFATGLYQRQLGFAYHGYVHRDPMSRLHLRAGRADPYPIYDRLRARGTLVPTRAGNWVSTSHRLCGTVLWDRRFGVRSAELAVADTTVDPFDMSFLDRDPPDHTRLRRLAQPAFSPRQMAGYRPRIERTVDVLLGGRRCHRRRRGALVGAAPHRDPDRRREIVVAAA
jgi:cytochrome P450